MEVSLRRVGALVVTTGLVFATLVATPAGAHHVPPPSTTDRARYILPPGNYGGLPTTDESRDQLPLYDGLTPLRGNVTDADIDSHYLPEDFKPVGATHEEVTGRPGTTIVYDAYGVPHITGKTRADLAFGAGWVTARDRGLLLQLGRGPARAAVADIPGINAFGLVTSGQSFVPSATVEQILTDQIVLIIKTYGDKGWQIIADLMAEAEGINAWFTAHGVNQPPVTAQDIIAVTAFIGSIFGAGGGAEASNAEFLSKLQNKLGPDTGRKAWEDTMLFGDPEAPTTITRPFDYGIFTGGPVTGSPTIDEDSVVSFDPRQGPTPAAQVSAASTRVTAASTRVSSPAAVSGDSPTYPAAGPVPSKQASNFLIVDPTRSATAKTLAVMGPQLGYYYPEIVEQIHLTGPGIEAQGVAVPGAAMYLLIGRTQNYAWSLTSANQDVRDVFVEKLCNPDGSAPTRASDHYMFQGTCRPFETFDADVLNGTPIVYPRSVHGPLIGTATSNGQPVALTRQRSTYARDGLNLGALKDMTEGKADTPQHFWQVANEFGFTFNWGYASRQKTAYFSSGYLPVRAPGLDRRLPTLGTGQYEWRGFLDEWQHPHSEAGPNGLLLNWNNQSAPGFMHGDDDPYGSVHRVELFNQFPGRVSLANDVSVMNRAATEDVRAPVWPVVSQVLRTGPAPNTLDAKVVGLLDDWVRRDAPVLDADNSGQDDDAGPAVMDALWNPLAEAVMRPVFGDLTTDLDNIRGLGSLSGESYVDKDLRTLLNDPVNGKFNLRYCGNGSLAACRAALWAVVDQVASGLAAAQGPDPTAWRTASRRITFTPGLIPDTMRAVNRPTFQQVLELAPTRIGGGDDHHCCDEPHVPPVPPHGPWDQPDHRHHADRWGRSRS
ncbi:MAG: penicillin acylase family protein [Acidimicrobiia bacterium]